jgi:hypothetical protein
MVGKGVGLFLQVMVHKTIFNTVFIMRQHHIQYIIQFKGHTHFKYIVESASNSQLHVQ